MTLPVDINDFIDPILRTFEDSLAARLNGYLVTAYLRGSAEMLEWGRTKTTDMPIYHEGPPMQQAMDYAQKHTATLVKGLNEETREQMRTVITKAIEQKKGIPGLTRDLQQQFNNMSKVRARVIARTETCDALEQSFMDRAKDMNVNGKEWVVTDPCPICEENGNAGAIPINQAFPSGDMRPPAHPNCLLPDVRVESPLTISGSRAFYNGDAIEFTTENGHKLTITPNHMILTPAGFVKVKVLKEGDYIVSCLDSKRITASINPYNDHSPAFIEDIWNSLMMQSGMVLNMVKTSAEDFYGDARFFNGDIDIIRPNSFLLSDITYALSLEHIGKHDFYWRYTKPFNFPSLGSLDSFRCWDIPAPDGFMSSSDPSLTIDSRHFGHTNNISLTTIPRGNTCLKQASSDSTPAYTELSRQFQFRFASFIAPEQIVKVRNFNYSGHVYDLQSLEQLYIANNIIVKNCRCALAPVMLGGK